METQQLFEVTVFKLKTVAAVSFLLSLLFVSVKALAPHFAVNGLESCHVRNG